MKKYNLSNIMKRAWELVKKAGMTISAGLKKAWKEAKNMTKALEDFFMKNGVKRWTKKNEDGSVAQDRIYINDVERIADVFGFDNPKAYRRTQIYYNYVTDVLVLNMYGTRFNHMKEEFEKRFEDINIR